MNHALFIVIEKKKNVHFSLFSNYCICPLLEYKALPRTPMVELTFFVEYSMEYSVIANTIRVYMLDGESFRGARNYSYWDGFFIIRPIYKGSFTIYPFYYNNQIMSKSGGKIFFERKI